MSGQGAALDTMAIYTHQPCRGETIAGTKRNRFRFEIPAMLHRRALTGLNAIFHLAWLTRALPWAGLFDTFGVGRQTSGQCFSVNLGNLRHIDP